MAVVSRAPSAPCTAGAPREPAAPANERVVRKRRRVCIIVIPILPAFYGSRLQLAFELVEEAPVGSVGDDLLRARLDKARLVHAQRVEARRVRSVIVSPSVVSDLVKRLEGVVVAWSE